MFIAFRVIYVEIGSDLLVYLPIYNSILNEFEDIVHNSYFPIEFIKVFIHNQSSGKRLPLKVHIISMYLYNVIQRFDFP